MFNSGEELLKLTDENKCQISEIVLQCESEYTEVSISDIKARMQKTLNIMKKSAKIGLKEDIKTVGGIIGGDAKRVFDYTKKGKTLCGESVNIAIARAYSCAEVNASMGQVCAAPTAGSCGIIPASVLTAAEILQSTDSEIIDALLTASGIGIIISKNATVSGAEGGCQAECGSAAAMAAGAIVQLSGGTPQMSLHAAAIALKNIMGLICDPVAGLVEAPCAKRNASGAVNALICADMALAGVKSIIPFDEVVEAMYKVGRMLPFELKETSLGGIATTKTGLEISNKIFNK
ncbi:L-serine ammonia-lyase, iron-sulfur-dependent, subunit alpha [Clostridiaceae bacterium M8S5]|nr:L-serine ammonia-lyase, iron-sulfur-dependent, subunit alpha [Clostridiaceae bacterium M8S5]